MTPHTATPPPKPSVVRRFGPLSIVLAGILVAAVLASTGESSAGPEAQKSDVGSADQKIPISLAQAEEEGTVDDYQWDDATCDRETKRVKLPSLYAPPCLANRKGIEGGATYQGVTADSIKVVLYEAADDDAAAALQANLDPPEKRVQVREEQIHMLESTFQMWGRKLDVVVMKGRGVDEENARADAVKVATEIKAFASIGGPAQQSAYAEELAARGVVCISCGLSMPDSTYQKNAPYIWGNLQTAEQFLNYLGDLVVGQLNGKNAEFAGDPSMHDKERVFGAVNFEQDPPVFNELADVIAERGKEAGYETSVRLTYQLVIPELPEKARTIVSQLKAAGVTTVMFLGDPIMPTYLTQAATDQNYFPEWIITGTVLTDTTALGRNYDQRQWAHAFGISSLPVMVPQTESEAWRLTEWFYGRPPAGPKTASVNYGPIQLFMIGVHMAGPDLTPETFRDGLFAYPPSGGTPTSPRISFGNQGIFEQTDYIAIDDTTLVWWDPEAGGLDEQGADTLPGHLRYADGGERYLPTEMGTDTRWIQRMDGSVLQYDEPVDEIPDYPSPAKTGD
ncbi:MAG: amino acid ABC transporter substrate-binding protein [Actinobacteria bacterium]|nr:amino acid ABC transporter substrate-binding protein [Actinomycetota bacterium]